MISLSLDSLDTLELCGATELELEAGYAQYDRIRRIERASIRQWMEEHRQYLTGKVLDFGAGTQPYRDLASGEYVPFEKGDMLPVGPFDVVMCNQVVQFFENPAREINWFAQWLKPGGHLLMTYPTNWDEVETDDLWRFTQNGMTQLLEERGLTVMVHDRRAEVRLGNFRFPLGYGVLARKS